MTQAPASKNTGTDGAPSDDGIGKAVAAHDQGARSLERGVLSDLGVLAVDHVGIAVPDLDQAIAFHVDVLGGRVEHREHNGDQLIDEAMIVFDESASSARIQLIAPTDPGSTIARFLDRSGPGLQQLAVRVADVRQAAETLRARGLRLLYDEPRRGTAGSQINFVHPKDAGGVLLELVQSP